LAERLKDAEWVKANGVKITKMAEVVGAYASLQKLEAQQSSI